MLLERVVGLASRLLARDAVFSAVQRALLSTLDARRTMERNVERILATANLPSARDLERVAEELAEMDLAIARLQKRVAALAEQLESRDAPGGGPR